MEIDLTDCRRLPLRRWRKLPSWKEHLRIHQKIAWEAVICRMFSHQPQSNYEYETRSLRVGGHSTSIRLERVFWTILEEMALREGSTVGKFVTTLHDEVLLHFGELSNLASLLRCSCMIYVSENAGNRALHEAALPPSLTMAAAE